MDTRENKHSAQEKTPKQQCTGKNTNRNAQEKHIKHNTPRENKRQCRGEKTTQCTKQETMYRREKQSTTGTNKQNAQEKNTMHR